MNIRVERACNFYLTPRVVYYPKAMYYRGWGYTLYWLNWSVSFYPGQKWRML